MLCMCGGRVWINFAFWINAVLAWSVRGMPLWTIVEGNLRTRFLKEKQKYFGEGSDTIFIESPNSDFIFQTGQDIMTSCLKVIMLVEAKKSSS